jgi:signal transduction histidine kinase
MHQSLASSEAKATLSTLAASASHELGTPLGNSMMAAGALSDQARRFHQMVQDGALKRSELSSFVETLLEGTGLIESNLHRANALLKNFRQVAADQASEQRRTFDLRTAVSEIVHAMSPTLKRHSHQIEIAIDEGIEMDSQPGPLGQVVINLINNAYLHAFEGRTSGRLTISATLHDDLVEMLFCDDGLGIAPENLDKLFLPFFSTKIGQGGTGLGMAIVQNLVTQTLFGRIDVQSTLGKGCCFELTLPRVLPTA